MNTKVQDYSTTFKTLQKNMKWKVSDKRILMTIASIYVMNNKKLDITKLLQLADKIKSRASLFSSMKSYPRFTTSAMLDVNFDDPEAKISSLYDYYHKLKQARFKSGTYTYIAATILLTNEPHPHSIETLIQKAKKIYDGMKQEHGFLTNEGDYPLAMLLAYQERVDYIQHIEAYYERLAKNGFRKGNDLQFLSHILSLKEDENPDNLVNRCLHVSDRLKEAGIRTKTMYYPVFGILSLLPPDVFHVNEIMDMYDALCAEKDFKWQKDMNVLMAVSFFVNDKLENKGLAETSIYTVLETVIQAQQAVMIATMAGATAAATSSSN
ncbi:Protein of unknown function [Oceanobacillus limi]|uniref:DUF4003 domain-containing protein n=1 Tax=Oceanobacillus limi TaxID=930131 RepID=A0A1I0GWI1_9BACI|nr:DUF4003 family protein [Oceanobacillus limi]SET75745.1 Protein of unknown function [Oceanobacillus limi]